jgi:hypothetical protein
VVEGGVVVKEVVGEEGVGVVDKKVAKEVVGERKL